MVLEKIEFATTMLFKRSILLKLKQLFAQYENRELEFYVVKFINDNKKYLLLYII